MVDAYGWLNVVVWTGYLAAAAGFLLLRLPVKGWMVTVVAAVLFFTNCGGTHADQMVHAFTRTPLTVDHMGDWFHVSHTAVQAVTIWVAVFGIFRAGQVFRDYAVRNKQLEVLLEEAERRWEPDSEWRRSRESPPA